MSKKTYRVRNWSQYNKSLVKRGDITFWFSPEMIKEWTEGGNQNTHGNQVYPDMIILCALTLRQLYRLPLRATEGLMASLAQLMHLNVSIPHYSTLSRRGKNLNISLAAQRVKEPIHVLVDSTGIQIIGGTEWKFNKYGKDKTRYQLWRKLHIAMDADHHTILSAKMTDSVRLDGNYLAGLIDQIKQPIKQITADGAYDKKRCYQKAYQRGAKPVFPPQHNACLQRNKYKKDPALLARDQAIKTIGRGIDRKERLKQWKENHNYHRRSLIETMMFRMKTLFGDQLRSRCLENQQTDLLIRCRAINLMNTLGMPMSEAA